MQGTSPAVSSAVQADGLEIPLVDFSAFIDGDANTRQATAQAILAGFQRAGFVYLRNHGISRETVRATFAASERFFARPEEQKLQLAWTTPEANRGYSQPGREKTTDATDADEIERIRKTEGVDLKESFEIGREGEEGRPNLWPDESDDDEAKAFRETMLEFHDLGRRLHVQIMRAIAVGMGMEERWFDGFCDGGDNTLRLLHYPSVHANVFAANEHTVRAGAHTDYGSITCLFQDMAGGLQVLSPQGAYVDATPIADTIVVNAGDLLARWSNDTIRSTKHRVVEPQTRAQVHPSRYSIAYFCNPNFDRFIDAIPHTFDEQRPRKYDGIRSGDYLVQRLAATY